MTILAGSIALACVHLSAQGLSEPWIPFRWEAGLDARTIFLQPERVTVQKISLGRAFEWQQGQRDRCEAAATWVAEPPRAPRPILTPTGRYGPVVRPSQRWVSEFRRVLLVPDHRIFHQSLCGFSPNVDVSFERKGHTLTISFCFSCGIIMFYVDGARRTGRGFGFVEPGKPQPARGFLSLMLELFPNDPDLSEHLKKFTAQLPRTAPP